MPLLGKPNPVHMMIQSINHTNGILLSFIRAYPQINKGTYYSVDYLHSTDKQADLFHSCLSLSLYYRVSMDVCLCGSQIRLTLLYTNHQVQASRSGLQVYQISSDSSSSITTGICSSSKTLASTLMEYLAIDVFQYFLIWSQRCHYSSFKQQFADETSEDIILLYDNFCLHKE